MWQEMQNGLEQMKQRAEDRKAVIRSPMAIVGYVWDVIRNLITLAIVFGVYSNLTDHDSVILFSGLLLIYLSVLTVGAGIGQYSVKASLIGLNMQLQTQKILLAKSPDDTSYNKEQVEEQEAELAKAGYMVEKQQYKFFINAAFLTILYIAAILHLLY